MSLTIIFHSTCCDIIIGIEIINTIKGISTIEVFDEEVTKLVNLIVSTESQCMVTQVPAKVILESKDILIKLVGHRRVVVTNQNASTTDIVYLNLREWTGNITLIANSYPRSTSLITHIFLDLAMQLSNE